VGTANPTKKSTFCLALTTKNKEKLIRKARTRFTYEECINNLWKEKFAGQPPHLSTRESTCGRAKGQFWVKMRILLVF